MRDGLVYVEIQILHLGKNESFLKKKNKQSVEKTKLLTRHLEAGEE